ncbi:MAG: hypothetical protein WD512_04735 [Candidatus Paceibacterota bacterium]
MENNNKDRPAFARTAFDKDGTLTTFDDEFTGLTKREYFAGLAMQAVISNPVVPNYTPEDSAKEALEYADALLKELEK